MTANKITVKAGIPIQIAPRAGRREWGQLAQHHRAGPAQGHIFLEPFDQRVDKNASPNEKGQYQDWQDLGREVGMDSGHLIYPHKTNGSQQENRPESEIDGPIPMVGLGCP